MGHFLDSLQPADYVAAFYTFLRLSVSDGGCLHSAFADFSASSILVMLHLHGAGYFVVAWGPSY